MNMHGLRWKSARGIVALLLTMLVSVGCEPWLPQGQRVGTLRLDIEAPESGAPLIEISKVGSRTAPQALVREVGEDASEEVELPVGIYRIVPRPMFVDGVRYVGTPAATLVEVRQGKTSTRTIEYAVSKGVQNLHVTKITSTSIALDWDAELGDDTTVWRVEGDDPVTKPGYGRKVARDGTALTDAGLKPGTTYSYSIFARPGDGRRVRNSRGHWEWQFDGAAADPVTITVGTAPADGATGAATFVLNPNASILKTGEFAAATPTGDGVRLDLRAGEPAPVPGAILSLPVTSTLPGGYLGEVLTVAPDGRSVTLAPAPMGEAFDFYQLSVPEIETEAAPATTAASADAGLAHEEARTGASRGASAAESASLSAAAGPVTCSGQSDIKVSPHIGLSYAGHASVIIDKHKILFVNVPTGVAVDVGLSATLTGTVDIEAATAVQCGLDLGTKLWPISGFPVPFSIAAYPEIGVSVSSGGKIENLGFAATAGFEVDGHMSFAGGNSFDGDLISSGTPTQPTATGNFGVKAEIGGAVMVGPGTGTSNAGVIAGIGGQLLPVDASVGVKQVNDGTGPSSCLELSAASTGEIFFGLRVWLPNYEADFRVVVFDKTFGWGGSPWHWPDDCTESEIPTDDVVGDGVAVIDDDLVGSSDQWGKVEGFVPGQNTWVLSTGRIQDAVGPADFFASTNLGGGGDAELSALSGFATYDATAYSVTVVPNGHTLHVRYAFASEEYPEFVGSSFNDVMAVFVNGQNCAFVPGTQTPVSINTINPGSHAEHYIDNSVGAAGYSTTMDGLTTPLTCSVPVVPGQPVAIKIAVADSSDGVYDSAVALLDGGIWSE